MNVPLTRTEPMWDDYIWDVLLAAIAKRQVIPVIGPALSLVEVDGGETPLDRYLAKRMLDRVGLDPVDAGTLDGTISRLREMGRGSNLHALVHRILQDEGPRFRPPKVMLQLAEISHFTLFVTTAFDSLLEKALTAVRYSGASPSGRVDSIAYDPDRVSECDIRDGARPIGSTTVYHLLGRVSALPDYVLTEEDLLEHICLLQTESMRPKGLFRELQSNHLLILGGNFPDWLARLFLRTTKSQRLSYPRDIVEVVADEHTRSDSQLVRFLTAYSRQTKIFSSNAPDFVTELLQRWRQGFGAGAPLSSPAQQHTETLLPSPDTIFISYASEDRDAALAVKDGLERAGLRVWFDRKRLLPGDEHDEAIPEIIESRCARFIALLSRNTERRIQNAYFRREWHFAVKRDTRNDPKVGFIVPVIIDEMSFGDFNYIPADFKKKTAISLPGGRVTPDFVEHLRRLDERSP